MRQIGVPEPSIRQMQSDRPSRDVLVFQDVWAAVEVFCAMSTQWNVIAGGMGGAFHVGLRYEGLPLVFDALGVPEAERRAVFADLRLMEAEALKVINKG